MKGRLYLVPNILGECDPKDVIPSGVIKKIHELHHFVVENTRTARRYLILLKHPVKTDELFFYELDKHTPEKGMETYINLCLSGHDVGIISEAGMPGIADPGSLLVKSGHLKGLEVIPLTGPSSILLALISSGLNGQNFTFNGYIPVKPGERCYKLRELEKKAKEGYAQVFMETPYRNRQLLETILEVCHPETRLCIASEITLPGESIRTMKISNWKSEMPDLKGKRVIFILQ